jgi:hypothetical protein
LSCKIQETLACLEPVPRRPWWRFW